MTVCKRIERNLWCDLSCGALIYCLSMKFVKDQNQDKKILVISVVLSNFYFFIFNLEEDKYYIIEKNTKIGSSSFMNLMQKVM